jgi:hypothetical protein
MKVINNVYKATVLIEELEKLYQQNKAYIFRGQPNSNFYLLPNAFRADMARRIPPGFPTSSWTAWCNSQAIQDTVSLYLDKTHIGSVWVRRISELTFYVMQYNYSLSTYVKQYPEKFDSATLEMYQLRPPAFWEAEKTFQYLFEHGLNLSIGRITLDGQVINYSAINEELAGYDESLPQHYGIPTAALDWTYNPYIAIFFALQNIPPGVSHFSIYAYKTISDDKSNPIGIEFGHPKCRNLRIERQEGLFTRFRYACLYYFFHGTWPNIETYIPLSYGNFELIKFNVPVCQAEYLIKILDEKGITNEYLLPT